MARPRDFHDILAKLPDAKKSRDVWIASCPLPGHKTPAGHVTAKDGGDKALITDHSGKHAYQDYCEAWGYDSLTYSPNGSGTEAKIIATYDYTDADGKLLYQVVRFEPKEFRQRQPNGNGAWVWNLKGVKPVLYRLPEVLKAVREGQTVYICEGEKDADILWSLGLVATTNPMGAGKWRNNYTEALRGADLIIIPDNDAPGRKHANHVAKSCYGIAKRIRVLELPSESKDASDWLDKGHTVDELEQLADACLDYEPTPHTEGEVKGISFAIMPNYLYEQIYTDEQSAFVEYSISTGETKTVSHIMQAETEGHNQLIGNLISKKKAELAKF